MAVANGTLPFDSFRCWVFSSVLTSGVVLHLYGVHQTALLIIIHLLQRCHCVADGRRERYASIRFLSLLGVLFSADEWGCSSSVRCSSDCFAYNYSSVAAVPLRC